MLILFLKILFIEEFTLSTLICTMSVLNKITLILVCVAKTKSLFLSFEIYILFRKLLFHIPFRYLYVYIPFISTYMYIRIKYVLLHNGFNVNNDSQSNTFFNFCLHFFISVVNTLFIGGSLFSVPDLSLSVEIKIILMLSLLSIT